MVGTNTFYHTPEEEVKGWRSTIWTGIYILSGVEKGDRTDAVTRVERETGTGKGISEEMALDPKWEKARSRRGELV